MKTWVKRSVRTFIQAAAGFMATNITAYCAGIYDTSGFKTALTGLAAATVAAGIAAVMNLKEE